MFAFLHVSASREQVLPSPHSGKSATRCRAYSRRSNREARRAPTAGAENIHTAVMQVVGDAGAVAPCIGCSGRHLRGSALRRLRQDSIAGRRIAGPISRTKSKRTLVQVNVLSKVKEAEFEKEVLAHHCQLPRNLNAYCVQPGSIRPSWDCMHANYKILVSIRGFQTIFSKLHWYTLQPCSIDQM